MRFGLPRPRRTRPLVASLAVASVLGALSVPIAVQLASAAPTTITDISSTFEDGQAGGWSGNGVVATPTASGTAHGGTAVLGISNKTGWGATTLDLSPVVTAGVEYTLTAYVRMVTGSGQVSMTVNAGSDYQNSGTYNVAVSDAAWTKLTRTYTLPAGSAKPSPLQVYFEMANFADFQVDDFTMTHVGTDGGDGTQVLVDHGFEDGTTLGWGPRGGVTVANSTLQAHAGTHSLLTTGRTATWNGPALDLLGRVASGTEYTFSTWVRTASGSDTLKLTIEATVDGTTGWTQVGNAPTVTDGAWTQLTGTWTAPAGATALTLYVEGGLADSSYYLDDALITYAGDPTPPTDPPLPDGLVKVTDFGANPSNLNMYVHVPARLADPAPVVVASHYCTGTAAAFYTGYAKEFVQASDRLGFIMVLPEATRDGHCFDPASPQALVRDGGSDPVGIRSMLGYVQSHYLTDPDRTFAIGVSSGAMMTNVLLANYPDVFKAGVSFMGVADGCFATGSSTNLWSNACADGTLVKTAQEWGDIARSADPGYTGPRPRIQLWHGTDDTTINPNNLNEAVKQWTNVSGVAQTPVTTTRLEGSWTRNRYGSGAVDAPVESISVAGIGHDLPQPGMTAYALAFLGLDAPVPDPPSTDPDENGRVTLVSNDFENGTTNGWTSRSGSEVVANSTEQAHGGGRSLKVTGRTETWMGPNLNLLGRVQPGVTYTFSAWVRGAAGSAPGTAGLTMERRTNDTPSYEGIGRAAISDSGWTRVSGTYTLGVDDLNFLKVYIETSGLQDFYVDDVLIQYVPALPIQTDLPSLKDEFAKFWPKTGAAVSTPELLGDHLTLLKHHFNQVTPGNAMKWDATEPAEGTFNFTDADTIVSRAQANGISVYGHVLAWHSQLPAWVFQDSSGQPLPVDETSKALVLQRLTNHITGVMTHFKGKVTTWDVVNEVISDADGETYRNSNWYRYTGLDFIRTAFRVAHSLDPDAQLCINDYDSIRPVKRAKYLALVQQLLAEGVPLTCVGHQMHVNLAEPTAPLGDALDEFAALGVRQRVTELDVSVYDNDTDSFDPIPQENLDRQRAEYVAIFTELFRHAKQLDSVTFWGLADDNTWLSTFPIARLNTPLLFDNRLQAKPAFTSVVDLAKGWTPDTTTTTTTTTEPTTTTTTTTTEPTTTTTEPTTTTTVPTTTTTTVPTTTTTVPATTTTRPTTTTTTTSRTVTTTTRPTKPPIPRITDITPLVVLPLKGTANAGVTLAGGWCLLSGAKVLAVNGSTTLAATLYRTGGAYQAVLPFTATGVTGKYDVWLKGKDCDGTTYAQGSAGSRLGSFSALAPTSVTIAASPRSPVAGATLTLGGTISTLSGGKLAGWSGATVQLEFRSSTSTVWSVVKTLPTGTGGAWSYATTAGQDGTWRVVFLKDANHDGSSAKVSVDVK